jgi:hypothetical protein
MNGFFKDFDFSDFWDNGDYSKKNFICKPPSGKLIESVESELGYKLPPSYIELMMRHNGGIPKKTCHPSNERTSWSADHIAITGIFGIGREKRYSLCGDLGSRFMIDIWNYPDFGVYFCDCPSGGHDMILMDYRRCGKNGEPEIVHVDQERNYKITFLAKNFETFIMGLVHDEEFDV